MNQYWLIEKKPLLLSQSDWETYLPIFSNRYENIGNIVWGKWIVRYLTDDIEPITDFLTSKGSAPVVIWALDINGNEVVTRNFTEYEKYVQPITTTVNGKTVTIHPEENTSAGWVPFDYVKPVIPNN